MSLGIKGAFSSLSMTNKPLIMFITPMTEGIPGESLVSSDRHCDLTPAKLGYHWILESLSAASCSLQSPTQLLRNFCFSVRCLAEIPMGAVTRWFFSTLPRFRLGSVQIRTLSAGMLEVPTAKNVLWAIASGINDGNLTHNVMLATNSKILSGTKKIANVQMKITSAITIM